MFIGFDFFFLSHYKRRRWRNSYDTAAQVTELCVWAPMGLIKTMWFDIESMRFLLFLFCLLQRLELAIIKDECCRRLQMGFWYSQLRLLCTGLRSAALFSLKAQYGMTLISSSVHQSLSDVSSVSLRITNSEQSSDQTAPAFAAKADYHLFIYSMDIHNTPAKALRGNCVSHFWITCEE